MYNSPKKNSGLKAFFMHLTVVIILAHNFQYNPSIKISYNDPTDPPAQTHTKTNDH
jgi:hypothetical protein